ncbi:olfactory receptor 2D2-like [Erpetoichthys calabaricus]|uniref:olfactory receptor 2D2-like n=1 Tax=Erpetoichthys calabaricus TaxID=27687 RepID=UPI002234A16E|nr:olfactory receptor 2D2-like [Erpetoichthys calabaricus]
MEPGQKSFRLQENLNYTSITQFTFEGFTDKGHTSPLIGLVFLISYIMTLMGNLFIFYIVTKLQKLHTPMYIMIVNLAVSDIMYSTTISPQLMHFYFLGIREIAFNMCFVQMFFLHYAACVDSFLMAAMSIDRFVSICFPLRYPSIITNSIAYIMCVIAWIFGLLVPFVSVLYSFSLPYCGPNKVMHLYCQHSQVARLACMDTSFISARALVLGCTLLLGSFFIIFLSYLKIIIAVLKIKTKEGKTKAFYTCSTQLIVVTIFYVPRIFVYLATLFHLYIPTDLNTALGIVYCLFPPLVNPVIYSFRTHEIRQFVWKKIILRK